MIRTRAIFRRRLRLFPREGKPEPCADLKYEIESKGRLISDGGIVSRLRYPLLDHDADRVLHGEGRSDVEQVQCSIRSPSHLLGKIFGEDSIAEHGSRTDRRHNGPLEIC